MTVPQLRPAAPLRAELDAIASAVDSAAAIPPQAVRYRDLPNALATVAQLENRLAALKLELLAEADRRRLAEEEAATGTDVWAARLTGSTRSVMAGGLWLVNLLQNRYHHTREAFALGQVDPDQVRVIVRAGEKIPREVSDTDRAEAEYALVRKAVNGIDAKRLRHHARRMLEAINKRLADAHEAKQLREEEDHAERETWLTLTDNADGTFAGRFLIPELHGHLLRNYLERLSTPARWSRNRNGDLVDDPTTPGMGPGHSFTERMGLALTELLEHLPTDGFGPVGADLLVTVDLESLQTGLGHARLDTGARISPGEARRLACNAGIVPAVLGSRSEPLDLGREARLHNTAQRRALALQHDTCAAEGCARPYAWCDIHHPRAWADGGTTDLVNGLPLCGHHHRRAHDPRYRTTLTAAGELRFRLVEVAAVA